MPLISSSKDFLSLSLGVIEERTAKMDTSVFVDLLKHQDGKLLLLGISLLAVVYKVTRILYRFYFHPLAKIPGPPLAIATYLYEWYYDIWHHGTYNSRLPQLHEKYGTSKVSDAGISSCLFIQVRCCDLTQTKFMF